MAITKVEKESLWVTQFLTTLEYRLFSQPVSLRANNREAILPIINLEFYQRTKYIEIQYYWIE